MTKNMRIEILRLPSLLREMQLGKFVVPAFQRPFAWSRAEVKLLLDSILHGYPIGAILLLRTGTQEWPILAPEQSGFPVAENPEPTFSSFTSYVIDGSQRLAALYNALLGTTPKLSFVFNLRDQEFIGASRTSESNPWFLNLRELFSSEGPSKTLAKFRGVDDSNLLFDSYEQLHYAFSEYELVVHTLFDMPIEEVLDIYARLNSAGRKLSKQELAQIRNMFGNAHLW